MNILFICTGNVSRSAVAECILRTMAEREGRSDINVASAGVHNLFGQAYDPQMIATAAKYGYHMEGHSRHMAKDMLMEADHILRWSTIIASKCKKNFRMYSGTKSIK